MVRILQISDPHTVIPPNLVSNTLDTFAILRSAIDTILARWELFDTIDAVVVTGDITDTGDLAGYRAFRDQIERLPVPYFLIPGNHDLRDPMRNCFNDMPFMPPRGKINWAHDLNGLRLIGLDTLIPQQGGGILDPETLDFLAEAVRDGGTNPLLIAMHHPPFQTGLWFMDQIGLEGVDPLGRILATAKGEIRIICGHVHSTHIGTVGGHTAVSAPSIVSAFRADFRLDAPVGFATGPSGYMVHDWTNGFRSAAIPLVADVPLFPF
jgi:3',5'-cyclic-AMP phosphodiesterase